LNFILEDFRKVNPFQSFLLMRWLLSFII